MRVTDRSFKSQLENMEYNQYIKLRGLKDDSKTYTTIVQQVNIAEMDIDIWLFIDTSE